MPRTASRGRSLPEVEGVGHGRIGEWPAWHVAPYVSIWAIESAATPEWVGWWVIAGDVPTDYIVADSVEDPRSAVRAFAKRWLELASFMKRGEPHPSIHIGAASDPSAPSPLLEGRAKLLSEWAEDASLWRKRELAAQRCVPGTVSDSQIGPGH